MPCEDGPRAARGHSGDGPRSNRQFATTWLFLLHHMEGFPWSTNFPTERKPPPSTTVPSPRLGPLPAVPVARGAARAGPVCFGHRRWHRDRGGSGRGGRRTRGVGVRSRGPSPRRWSRRRANAWKTHQTLLWRSRTVRPSLPGCELRCSSVQSRAHVFPRPGCGVSPSFVACSARRTGGHSVNTTPSRSYNGRINSVVARVCTKPGRSHDPHLRAR